MTDCKFQSRSIGKFLEGDLPQSRAGRIAAATVSCDEQFFGIRKPLAAHTLPPGVNGIGREFCCVVADSDAHPTFVVLQIVHTVRDSLSQLLVFKIVHADLLRPAPPTIFPATILEIAHQFLLFRVDGHSGLMTTLKANDLLVQIRELRVAIGMTAALTGFAVCLQTESCLSQQRCHRAMTDRMALFCQCLGQHPGTANRPAQGRFRFAAFGWLHKRLQSAPQFRIVGRQRFATAARAAHACDDSSVGCCSSTMPARIVVRDKPVATATTDVPPQPSSKASAAAHTRRERSSNSGPSRIYIR